MGEYAASLKQRVTDLLAYTNKNSLLNEEERKKEIAPNSLYNNKSTKSLSFHISFFSPS